MLAVNVAPGLIVLVATASGSSPLAQLNACHRRRQHPVEQWRRQVLIGVGSVQAMRLFVGDPVWTPINRCDETDAHPVRTAYVEAVAAC